MTRRFHIAIVATVAVAVAAVGIASAATLPSDSAIPATKADRLFPAAAASGDFVTIEHRVDGTSVLARVPLS